MRTWQAPAFASILIATMAFPASSDSLLNAHPSRPEAGKDLAACAPAQPLATAHLIGSWQVHWESGHPATEWMRLRPNPEFAGSVTGDTRRDNLSLQLAGDIDGDQLTLEESSDGKTISGTWVVPLAQAAMGPDCAWVLKGVWTRDPDAAPVPGQTRERPFTLRKSAGW